VVGSFEHNIEPLGSLKVGEFLGQPSDCWCLKKFSVPWCFVLVIFAAPRDITLFIMSIFRLPGGFRTQTCYLMWS